jgi:hypothetical protein
LPIDATSVPRSRGLTPICTNEEHGGRHVRVRGPVKVAAHLAFGLLVIAAEQMLRMIG